MQLKLESEMIICLHFLNVNLQCQSTLGSAKVQYIIKSDSNKGSEFMNTEQKPESV